jgi:hypothetical protein
MKILAFYKRYGAYPIINITYEKPIKEDDNCTPYLVYDDLGNNIPLRAFELRIICKAILESNYSDYCPRNYLNIVVNSVMDNPFKLTVPRYVKTQKEDISLIKNSNNKIQLFVNGKHRIHPLREIGYVESPVRAKSIFREIIKSGIIISEEKVKEYPVRFIYEIHDRGNVQYFTAVCSELEPVKSDTYVFPIRNVAKPLKVNAYLAPRWGVNCSLTAADIIYSGRGIQEQISWN